METVVNNSLSVDSEYDDSLSGFFGKKSQRETDDESNSINFKSYSSYLLYPLGKPSSVAKGELKGDNSYKEKYSFNFSSFSSRVNEKNAINNDQTGKVL